MEQDTDEVYARITLLPESDVRIFFSSPFLLTRCFQFGCRENERKLIKRVFFFLFTQQTEPIRPDPCLRETQKQTSHSFCKILTTFDASTHAGFSVLRKHANECLPQLVFVQLS